jgi:hypothetical protein
VAEGIEGANWEDQDTAIVDQAIEAFGNSTAMIADVVLVKACIVYSNSYAESTYLYGLGVKSKIEGPVGKLPQ